MVAYDVRREGAKKSWKPRVKSFKKMDVSTKAKHKVIAYGKKPKVDADAKKTRRNMRKETFFICIYNLIKQTYADSRVSTELMTNIYKMASVMFGRALLDITRMAGYKRVHVQRYKIVQAVQLALSGELTDYDDLEEAITRFIE